MPPPYSPAGYYYYNNYVGGGGSGASGLGHPYTLGPGGFNRQVDLSDPEVINNALLVGGAAFIGLIAAQAFVSNAVSTNSNNIDTNTNTVSTNTASVASLCAADSNIASLPALTTIAIAPTLNDFNTLGTAINNLIAASATANC